MKASQAAECAGDQGRYWEMHTALFSKQHDLSETHFADFAHSIGLNAPRFRQCLSGTPIPKIKEDQREAARLGVQATPTFLVGKIQGGGTISVSRRINGAAPYETFKSAIRDVL
jgi:protein-disulfide isomerase